MTVPEWVIVVLTLIECLAVIGMGIAAFLMYRRFKTVNAWVQPTQQEARAVADRTRTTALETKDRVLAFTRTVQALVQHVKQKAQTTARLAREVVQPALPLQDTARALTGAEGVTRRLARLREAGKIAAGDGSGSRSRT